MPLVALRMTLNTLYLFIEHVENDKLNESNKHQWELADSIMYVADCSYQYYVSGVNVDTI